MLFSVSRKGQRLRRKWEEATLGRLSPGAEGFRGEEVEQPTGLLQRFSVSLLSSSRP